jgi:hypothetical protein
MSIFLYLVYLWDFLPRTHLFGEKHSFAIVFESRIIQGQKKTWESGQWCQFWICPEVAEQLQQGHVAIQLSPVVQCPLLHGLPWASTKIICVHALGSEKVTCNSNISAICGSVLSEDNGRVDLPCIYL